MQCNIVVVVSQSTSEPTGSEALFYIRGHKLLYRLKQFTRPCAIKTSLELCARFMITAVRNSCLDTCYARVRAGIRTHVGFTI